MPSTLVDFIAQSIGHRSIKMCVCLLLGLLASIQAIAELSREDPGHPGAPYVADRPLNDPTIFGQGVISTGDYESHPAFTPDGKTLYFLKDSPDFAFWTMFVSQFQGGRWTEPQVAPFSGQYRDADPFISADGSKFLFISDRPVPGKKHRDLDIWIMERNGKQWGDPHNFGLPINSEGNEWYPTLAADGTLYFGSDRPGGMGKTDLYRSRLVDGKYAEPENLGSPINTESNEYEPYIASDQSFVMFMADNREEHGDLDLYISYQRNGSWTRPVGLPNGINSAANEYSPKISPDGRYFFWTSTRNTRDKRAPKSFTTQQYLDEIRSAGNGLGDIYQIDLSIVTATPMSTRLPARARTPSAKVAARRP